MSRRKRKERQNGDGYIFRAGKFWYLRFRDWRVIDGQPQWKQVCEKLCEVEAGYRSKKPTQYAQDKAKERLGTIHGAAATPKATQTLVDYAEAVYFPDQQRRETMRRAGKDGDGISPSTLRGYKDRWQALKPWLKTEDGKLLNLRDTEAADIKFVFGEICEHTEWRGSYIGKLKNLLSQIFNHAICQKGMLPKGFANPCMAVKMSNGDPQRYAYSLEQIAALLALLPEPARTIVAVAAYTGLRRGEIRGLRWEDYGEVVFDDGTTGWCLHVQQSVWNGITTAPKTESSSRFVPVIPQLRDILDAHQRQAGVGVMFPNDAGKAADLNNLVNRELKPLLKQAGITWWRGWHGFRRGLATNMHRLNVPDKDIAQILGHSDVKVTQKCYVQTTTADAVAGMARYSERLATALVQ